MMIRTVDEYRVYISRPDSAKSKRSRGAGKYFEAGFHSAAAVIREKQPKKETRGRATGDDGDHKTSYE